MQCLSEFLHPVSLESYPVLHLPFHSLVLFPFLKSVIEPVPFYCWPGIHTSFSVLTASFFDTLLYSEMLGCRSRMIFWWFVKSILGVPI